MAKSNRLILNTKVKSKPLRRRNVVMRTIKSLLLSAALFGGMWFFYEFTPADHRERLRRMPTNHHQTLLQGDHEGEQQR